MGTRLTLALFAVMIGVGSANAADLTLIHGPRHKVITVQGSIGLADVDELADMLAAENGIREIWFDSGGGNLEAGIRIGEAIRIYNIATRIRPKSKCASACAYAFMGGIIRTVDPGGRIGIHMASGSNSSEYISAIRDVLTDKRITDLEDRVRAVVLINEQFSAKAARRQARFLAEMGISLRLLEPVFDTPHSQIYWLSDLDLQDFNVVN